jgi:hypothetical protein
MDVRICGAAVHKAGGWGRMALQLIEDQVRDIGMRGVSLTTMDTVEGNALQF